MIMLSEKKHTTDNTSQITSRLSSEYVENIHDIHPFPRFYIIYSHVHSYKHKTGRQQFSAMTVSLKSR